MSAQDSHRRIIRRATEILSRFPAWERKPCASLKALTYGLNTLWLMYPGLKYNTQLPRPSVPARQLSGIGALAARAARTGNLDPLRNRLAALRSQDADAYALLAFQAAVHKGNGHPAGAARDPDVIEYLTDAAPALIHKFAQAALTNVEPRGQIGRGGHRHGGPDVQYALIREIGFLFETITGRKPGITFKDAADDGRRHSGPFVEVVQIVFESLGLKINGRQVMKRLAAIEDVPEWDRPARRSWRGP